MENILAKALDDGKKVNVKIDITYPSGGGNRPSGFDVNYIIDGEKQLPYKFKQ